jgi:hypothetical protein
MYSKKLALVLESVLKNFEYVFGEKEEQMAVYRKSQHDMQEKFKQTLNLEEY